MEKSQHPSAKFLATLRHEATAWVEAGLISEEQAGQILARYDISTDPPWYRRTDFILKGIALLLAGMAVFSLLAQNWSELGVPLQMMTGIVPLMVCYYLVYRFEKQENRQASELAFFFASLLLGANIALQAQIFHISAYFPNGLLWWIIGTLPVILYFESLLAGFAMQGIYLIWLGMQNEYEQFSFWSIPIMAVFVYLTYRKPTTLGLFGLALTGFMFLFNMLGALEGFKVAITSFIGFYTFLAAYVLLFLALFRWIAFQYSEQVRRMLFFSGSLVIVFTFYLYTFEYFVRENVGRELLYSAYFIFVLAIALHVWWIQKRPSASKFDFNVLSGITAIFFMLNLLPYDRSADFDGHPGLPTAFAIAVVMNVLFFAFSLLNIFYGINRKSKQHFINGIACVLLLALTRYLNYFENYFATSLVFLGSALFIYYANKLWKNRYAK